jgi:hypothetical protein
MGAVVSSKPLFLAPKSITLKTADSDNWLNAENKRIKMIFLLIIISIS